MVLITGGKQMETAKTIRTFEILASKRHAFEKQMAHLTRKAGKLGVEAPSYTMGEAKFVNRTTTREDGSSHKYIAEVYSTTVTSIVVKIPGWTFLATLEHLEGGETLLRAIAEGEIPATYRTAGPACDHCKLARKRNDTYLVRSDAGEIKQIGRACIADFLGHKDPEHLARLAEFVADSMGHDDYCAGGENEEIADILDFMIVVQMLVRTIGFFSKKMLLERPGQTTASAAFEILFPFNEKMEKAAAEARSQITDADRDRAQLAIDWILGLDGEQSDFIHNVRAVVRTGAVKRRTAGYAAALSVAYARAMDEIREHAVRPISKHVGEIGQRLIFTATIHKIIAMESQFGTTHLHIMSDADGNDLKWFGSSTLGEEDDIATFKGTVKAHDEYKGRAQTLVSRCALYTPPEPKVKKPRAKKVKEVASTSSKTETAAQEGF